MTSPRKKETHRKLQKFLFFLLLSDDRGWMITTCWALVRFWTGLQLDCMCKCMHECMCMHVLALSCRLLTWALHRHSPPNPVVWAICRGSLMMRQSRMMT
jgi:hypothetical protein